MAESKKPFFVPQELQTQTESLIQPSLETVTAQVTEEKPTKNVEKKEPYLPVVNLKQLPSKFLPYPQGVEISYSPYKFGELKKFSQSKLSIKQRYEFILEGITVSGMDKEDLTFQDFLFIALLRKMSSVGNNDLLITFNCLKCEHKNQHHIMLDALDFDEIEVPELPAILEIKDHEMSFTPLTLKDFFTLFKEGKEKDSVAILAAQCRSHEFEQAYDILFGANPEDSQVLEELNKVFYHGLATLRLKCQNKEAPTSEFIDGVEIEKLVHCDFENRIELGDPDLIVQPFCGDRRTPKDRIRFGSGSKNKP
jgi:hypothetical protein